MKKIIFTRHAKSSWNYNVDDINRPLKKRGIVVSGLVSNALKNAGFSPEVVFSSPALRAQETCKNFVKNLNINDDNMRIEDQLYDFGGNKVINFIKSLDDSYKNIMVFGHNHALTSIVNTYGNIYIDNLPTCGLVILKFDIECWSELNQGETMKMIFPRDLKG
jgi:phosphohistidine phosphatase